MSFKIKLCLNLLNWISYVLGILLLFLIFSALFSADAKFNCLSLEIEFFFIHGLKVEKKNISIFFLITSYKIFVIGKEREQEVKKFIEEENTQWKKVSEDIKNVLPNLEKGLENWKLYNNGIETLTHFINEGESVMSRSVEEKQQHFSETPENEEKLRQVNDSGNFLMEVCSEPIADEIRQTLASLNTEFKTVTESFEEFKRVEIIGKGKQEYAEGVNRISEWLKNAEELMMQPVPCIHANLKDHLQDLTVSITSCSDLPSVNVLYLAEISF